MTIRIENLSYTYMQGSPFEKKALDNVSLTINKGEIVGIIGHTGSGKSTLISHLNGLTKPMSGKVFVNDIDLSQKSVDMKKVRQTVGLVFQYPEYQLFEETVYRDIAFGPINMGMDQEQVKKNVYDAAEFVGIKPELMEKSPFELSGGQKRRVAIAGVLAMKPDILVLDEPTAGLDPYGREGILNRIKKLHQTLGITVIFVSHSMEDVAKIAQRVIVMNNAKVAMTGTPREVFKRYDELNLMGLSAPQVTILFNRLAKRGILVDNDVYTVEDARDRLYALLGWNIGQPQAR